MLSNFAFGSGLGAWRESYSRTVLGLGLLAACSSNPAASGGESGSGGASSNAAGTGSTPSAGQAGTGVSGANSAGVSSVAGSGGASGAGGAAAGGASATGQAGGAGAGASSGGSGAFAAVVHIAGDSTAAIFPSTDPRVGWGAVFAERFDGSVKVDDRALSGRSTKSYIDEGAWAGLVAVIKQGDYVFIEFGHNDEKADDPLRYTDPATTFRDNLRKFVTESRAAGGQPLLLTPISRNKFSGTTVTASHGLYPDAVKAVATETNTPLIDMTARTKTWLEMLGPSATAPFFAPGDQTHTSLQGAEEVSKLVAAGLKDLSHPLAAFLK